MKEWTKKISVVFLLIAADLAGILISYAFAYQLRAEVLSQFLGNLPPPFPIRYYIKYLYLLLIWPITFMYEGLYTKNYSESEEIIKLWKALTIATLLTVILLFALKVRPSFSRSVLAISYATSLFVVPLIRLSLKRLLFSMNLGIKKIVFIGSSNEIKWLQNHVKNDRTCGYSVIAHFKKDELVKLPEIYRKEPFDVIITSNLDNGSMYFLQSFAQEHSLEIMFFPENIIFDPQGIEVEEFFGFKALKLKYNLLIPRNATIKRILDLLASLIIFIVIFPVFIFIVLLVKITSKGPVFFKQTRIGLHGKKFILYKFRTMYLDADERLNTLLKENPGAKEEWKKFRKLRSIPDPRITPLGKILRKFSLDELPQFLNIMKGDMSLVGPRPYLEEELKFLGKRKDTILSVKPGLTGLWQVSGRNEVPFEERVLLDEYYVRNWSIFLDIAILVRTVFTALKGEGAY